MASVRGSGAPDDLCTVDDAAARLHVHPKTVLRFIRDGRLRATRIGRGYRILRADLDAFAGVPAPAAPVEPRVTSIVDIDDVGPTLAQKLASSVTNSLHSRPPSSRDTNAQVIHDPDRRALRIVITGTPVDTSNLLALIAIWCEQLTP